MFTKVTGNHTIKFGEDFRHTRDFLLQTQDNGGPRGQFQFRAPQTSIPDRRRGHRAASRTRSRRSCSTCRRSCSAISR